MARTLTLTVHEILQAAMRLRQLDAAPPTPGVPAPPFNAVLRASAVLKGLMPILTKYVAQEAALRAQYALRDTNGQVVIVKDPNGNIQNGEFYAGDAPKLSQALNDLRAETKEVSLGALSLDDVVDISRGALGVDALNDLLPIVDPPTLSDDGERRLQAYQTAAAVAPPT